jgi:hypothetical protein
MKIITNIVMKIARIASLDFQDRLLCALKNQTDGFLATVLEPRHTGLTAAYIVFNCYGVDRRRRILMPKRHRKMIVEIAKDNGGDRPCKRFKWNELIPVEVSESPKIMLSGKKLKRALSLFSRQDWNDIYSYIAKNRCTIQRHWTGQTSSTGLFEELNII